MFPAVSRRRATVTSPMLLLVAALSALVVFAAVAVVAPTGTRAASVATYASNCGTNLRTKASLSGRIRTSISKNAKITVVKTVNGGSWRATCAGKSVKGSTWYRIGAVNGRSVYKTYGVSYLYAATGLFRVVTTTGYAGCDDVSVRTSARLAATRLDLLDAGDRITAVARVTGDPWTAECGGKTVSGNWWWRIGAVNGASVFRTYGVGYLYAATGLFGSTPPPPPAPASSGVTEGIDVSHWQGKIDWAKVRAAGKRFAFIKASEDTDFVDDKYAANKAAAKAAGLHVGAYHFAQPATKSGDAAAEADHFVATADISHGDLLPVLDLEVANGLNAAELQGWTKSFLQRLYERTGVRAILYVSPAFWKTNMANTNWFAENGYKVLWDAHWTTASDPSVPADNWAGNGWTFWQYSAEGVVPGISGRVDLNRYNGSDFTPVRVP